MSDGGAACCTTAGGGSDGATTTREAFLQAKAVNFLALLERHGPNAELRSLMSQYKPAAVLGTCLTVLKPIQATGKLDELPGEVVRRLEAVPEGQEAALQEKVERYLSCFLACISEAE